MLYDQLYAYYVDSWAILKEVYNIIFTLILNKICLLAYIPLSWRKVFIDFLHLWSTFEEYNAQV